MRVRLGILFLLLALPVEAQILTVPNGGTGQSNLPAHAPVVGNGTAPVNTIPPGTAGQCLVSGGPNVDPVFAACPGGSSGGGNPGGILGYPQSYGTGAVFAGVLTELIVDNFPGATIDAKIAAAQAALPANGGILTLSCTNYAATAGSITLSKNNVTLRGCGGAYLAANIGATTLNFPAATTGIIVTGANVSIEKLALISTATALGTADGIQLSNAGPKIKNVSIARFSRDGIRFVDQTDLWMLEDINSQNNYRDGIRLDGPCTDNSIGVSTRITTRFNAGWGLNVLCGWNNMFIDTHSDNNTLGAGHTSAGYNTYQIFYTEIAGGTSTLFQFDNQAQYNRIWVNAFGQPTIQDNAPQGSNEIFYTAATAEGNYPGQTVFRITTKPNAAVPYAVTLIAGASYTTPDLLWRDNTNGVNLLDYAPSFGWKFLRPVTIGMENSIAGSLSIASGSSIYKTTIATQTTTANTQFNLPPDNGANGSCLITNGAGNTSWSSSCGGSSGSMTYPAAGIANSTGTAGPWGTSYSASNQIPANFISTLNQSTTGNAATATALAATPTQCTSGNFATGIAANGNANCSAGGGGPGPSLNIPGVIGDLLFGGGNNTVQVDSGNATYDATNKILSVPSIQLNSPLDGYASYQAGSGAIPALPTSSMGFSAPPTGGTSGLIKLPGTLSAGAFTLAAPASLSGVNQSQASVTPIATSATANALVKTNASGTIDPSFVTGGTQGGGNVSSGTGVAQYLIPVWQSSTTIGGIASGNSGYVLTSNGAGTYPSWQPAAGGPGGGTQPSFPVTSFNSSVTYPVSSGEFANCQTFAISLASPNIQLPASTPTNGQCIWVINYGQNAPVISRLGSQTINGSTNNIILQAGSATNPVAWKIISDGTNFVGQRIPGGTIATLGSGTVVNSAFTLGTGSSLTFTAGSNAVVNANQINGAAIPASTTVLATDANGRIIAGSAGGGNVSSTPSPAPTLYQVPVWQSATTLSGVGPGNAGDVFTSGGASAPPAWQPPGAVTGGGTSFPVVTLSAGGTTAVTTQQMQSCTTFAVPSLSPTIQLPSPPPSTNGACLWVINYGTGAPTITHSDLVNGSASNYVVPAGTALNPTGLKIISTGTAYVAQRMVNGTFTQLASGTSSNLALTMGNSSTMVTTGTGKVMGMQYALADDTVRAPGTGGFIAAHDIVSDTQVIAPQFTVNQTPPLASPFGAQRAVSRLAQHTSAFRIISPNDQHYLDINVPDNGDPSIISSTGTVTVSGSGGPGPSPGGTAPVYDKHVSGIEMLGTGTTTITNGTVGQPECDNFGNCTMLSPTSDGTYRIELLVIQTTPGSSGCSGGTGAVHVSYTDGDSGATVNWQALIVKPMNSNSMAATFAMTTVLNGTATTFQAFPTTIHVRGTGNSGTPIRFRIYQQAASTGCSGNQPTYSVRIALFGPLGY